MSRNVNPQQTAHAINTDALYYKKSKKWNKKRKKPRHCETYKSKQQNPKCINVYTYHNFDNQKIMQQQYQKTNNNKQKNNYLHLNSMHAKLQNETKVNNIYSY